LVPHSEINKYINLSDVCLVLLKNDFKLKDSVPSKIFEYMAARKPIIINLEGEGSKIIEEAQCGLIIKPDNPNDLKEAILKLYNDRFLREKLGLNGYNYVNYNFNKEDLANQLEKILHAFIK
ncbi:MAG: glycosyltransferase, partial [Minisyncoccia bacterium]